MFQPLFRSLRAWMCRTGHDESGQSAPLMMLAFGLALVGGVMVIDVGLLFDEHRQAQAAADFAALAASQDLPRSPSDPDLAVKMTVAQNIAHDYLEQNGFDPDDADVTASITTSYDGEVDQIEVTVTRTRSWMLGRIFGLGTVDVSGRAVAAAAALPRDVVVTLDRSGSMCSLSHGSGCDGWPWVEDSNSSSSTLTENIEALSGQMVVTAYAAGGAGAYTANNGFTIGNNQTSGGTMTGATGYKLSAGGTENVSMSYAGASANRQQMMATTLPSSGGDVTLIGGWQTGLNDHDAPAGTSRRLVFMTMWEDSGTPELDWVRYGNVDLTRVGRERTGGSTRAGVEIWILEEDDIAAAANNDFTVSWDEGVNDVVYSHAFFDNVGQGPGWEPFDTMRNAADLYTASFMPYVEGVEFDYLSLASYSSEATLDQTLTLDYLNSGSAFKTALWGLSPSGYTNIGHAIYVARQELATNGHAGNTKTIVLLTDGIANVYRSGGTDESPIFSTCGVSGCSAADDYAVEQATLAAADGYSIFTIGLTDGAGEDLLQEIADIGANQGGGGQFFDVDNPDDLYDTFTQIADLLAYVLVE